MQARPSIPFLLDLLRLAVRKEAAAIYVVPWMPPTLRIDERSVPLSSVAFTPEQSTLLVLDVLDEAQRAQLDRSREIQFSFQLAEVGRFRVHAFRRHGQPAMSIRPYAEHAPTLQTLALPALAGSAALADRGLLVLVSRSSTLRRNAAAALLTHRIEQAEGEVVVLDDASRYWHESVRCKVHQGLSPAALDELMQRRSAAIATASAPPGPLAIAWGELRDQALLERLLRCTDRALCLVTLQADNPLQALQRLMVLAEQRSGDELRRRTAIALNGLLNLRPVPAADAGPDLAATEVLMNSPELAANLADGDLPAVQLLVAGIGPMHPADAAAALHGPDQHLGQLVRQGLVTALDALRHAVDPDAFARRPLAPDAAGSALPTVSPDTKTDTDTTRVDTGFADLFDTATPALDAFHFADAAPASASPDTQFDGVDWAGEPTPSKPAGLHSVLAAETRALPHSAQFHAWAPPAVVPGRVAAIDLWVALPSQAGEVAIHAHAATEPPPEAAMLDDGTPQITLQLRIDGILQATTTRRLVWVGQPARVRFEVPVPAHALPGAHAARVRLAVGGLHIGEMSFVLNVMPNAAPDAAPENTHAARRMLVSAYAAYVQPDRDEVLACVQAMQRVAPGLQVFLDAAPLRSQPQWRSHIDAEVGRRERLYLFWSRAAAESPWIDYEWRLTLRNRGPGVIDLVLLEPPRLAPLPAELSDLGALELRRPMRPTPGTH